MYFIMILTYKQATQDFRLLIENFFFFKFFCFCFCFQFFRRNLCLGLVAGEKIQRHISKTFIFIVTLNAFAKGSGDQLISRVDFIFFTFCQLLPIQAILNMTNTCLPCMPATLASAVPGAGCNRHCITFLSYPRLRQQYPLIAPGL